MIHGIKEDPWKLPSYRFGSLVIAFMKDDKMPEGIKQIDDNLATSDELLHPFFDPAVRRMVKAMCGALAGVTTTSTTIDNVIYDSRFVDELPVEERKKREAVAKGKPYRVPDWWRGEQANYKIAKSMMGVLPKKGKQPMKDK